MSRVCIAGIGMTAFGKFTGRGVRALAVEAIDTALQDAGVPAVDIQKVYFGNAIAGVVTQQEMIRGQVALRGHALGRVPLINVENACASSSSALHLAFESIMGQRAEVVLVVGAEQMNHVDKLRAFNALRGATDLDELGELGNGSSSSILMEFYARVARDYLETYGATVEDFANVAVKNRRHAAANPLAHFRTVQSASEVLQSRTIVSPLTLAMCAPTTDGAAALIVCSEAYARRLDSSKLITVLASHVAASPARGRSPVQAAAAAAFQSAGLGIDAIDVIELHDAAAPAELAQYVDIGLCEPGEAHHLLRRGVTSLGGAKPVNTSGGLLSRGHPLGATGCAQIVELCMQLRGIADARQVEDARVGLAVNGGGWLDDTYALAVATILQRSR